ncbi:contractile injection system tape measure protein [Bacteroides sp. UBA939]|uniref:contractile injection system tape measure protein n=1 Tax=Bacteroides sp. UBA939 TaxID=1946092 RepID=UPI0025BA5CFD|nr:contractile injection system tape measure protein [Bacteroides sp. UBA939]
MILIDHISFEFTAPDEVFAHRLYADWDDFCHRCFEQVVEECCTTYDKEKVLYEIERLELNLGNIPEEEFHSEFPRRLREELLKALSSLNIRTADEVEKSAASRRDNLLFFLEHGFPKPEWTDGDFNPSIEAEWLLSQSTTIYMPFIQNATLLCLGREHALRRLLWQTDNVEMHLRIYTTALAEPSAGLQEKHRFLALILEEKPGIAVRFIHKVGSDEELHSMTVLLDSPTVRQLMQTEMKEHAEVDLPPYWHYLYEWLIQYYPFNGLAMFGGKAEFIRHLHHRLLTFIRKRSDSPYLSKVELTLDFLLEVFGHTYYKDVLNDIYELQASQPDGSPVYDGYFNRELYRIFMQLSLLRQPAIMKQKATGEKVESQILFEERWNTTEGFTAWLEDSSEPAERKRELLQTAVTENTQEWMALLRKTVPKEGIPDAVTDNLPVSVLQQGMAKVSFYQASVLSRTIERIEQNADAFPFLTASGIPLSSALSKALLLYMQDADTLERTLTEREIIEKFLAFLYHIYTGQTDYHNETGWKQLSEEIIPKPEQQEDSGQEEQEVAKIRASLPLYTAELLRQVTEVLRLDEEEQRLAWSTYMATGKKEEEWSYSSPEEKIRLFVQTVVSLQGQGESEVEETVRRVKAELKIQEDVMPVIDKVPEFFLVGNAGLCLFTPWFIRLFGMLGYLDEERNSLKNTTLKIRAVFLLQYVVYGEEREYRETELVFNRLLTGLSRHIPLPKYLPLTDEEKQTADSMVTSIKAYWSQMNGTSVEGFRQSFIARNGTLEQQEEQWSLSVEKKTHDILLNSVSWSFRKIRLPWLKKYIQVVWNEKQELP